jgi:hypothetical protein
MRKGQDGKMRQEVEHALSLIGDETDWDDVFQQCGHQIDSTDFLLKGGKRARFSSQERTARKSGECERPTFKQSIRASLQLTAASKTAVKYMAS